MSDNNHTFDDVLLTYLVGKHSQPYSVDVSNYDLADVKIAKSIFTEYKPFTFSSYIANKNSAKLEKGVIDVHNHSIGSDGKNTYQEMLHAFITSNIFSENTSHEYIENYQKAFRIHGSTENCNFFSLSEHNTYNSSKAIVKGLTDNQMFIQNKFFYPCTINANLSPKLAQNDEPNILNFVPAVEMTAIVPDVPNVSGRPTKIHILVYGLRFDKASPLNSLIKLKNKNDIEYDKSRIAFLCAYKGIPYPSKEINEYSMHQKAINFDFQDFNKHSTIDFLNTYPNLKHKLVKNDKELKQLLSCVPKIERITLSAYDIIKLAHENGCIVIMAHPDKNLMRTETPDRVVTRLVENGIDGFALKECHNENYAQLIKDKCACICTRNPILFDSVGNDAHSIESVSKVKVYSSENNDFIHAMTLEQSARAQGRTSYRRYRLMTYEDCQKILDFYSEQQKDYYDIFLQRYTALRKRIEKQKHDEKYYHAFEQFHVQLGKLKKEYGIKYYEHLTKEERMLERFSQKAYISYLKQKSNTPQLSVAEQMSDERMLHAQKQQASQQKKFKGNKKHHKHHHINMVSKYNGRPNSGCGGR